jgi:hypothetical protein
MEKATTLTRAELEAENRSLKQQVAENHSLKKQLAELKEAIVAEERLVNPALPAGEQMVSQPLGGGRIAITNDKDAGYYVTIYRPDGTFDTRSVADPDQAYALIGTIKAEPGMTFP